MANIRTLTIDNTTYSLQDTVSGYAPLASPALTGTPTAPTAASGTDTTQIATTAFVQDAISGAGSGSVTSVQVQATSPVQSSVNTEQTSSLNTTISLADAYGDTKNPYGTKTKNYVLAGPATGSAAAPSFRALVADDIPDLSSIYLKSFTETDPVYSASVAAGITSSDITNWNGKTSLTIGTSSSTAAAGNHTHGNITNDGKLQTTDVAIGNGDKIIVTDSSDSNKIARTSITFDGSTTTKALSQKGTWETFGGTAVSIVRW